MDFAICLMQLKRSITTPLEINGRSYSQPTKRSMRFTSLESQELSEPRADGYFDAVSSPSAVSRVFIGR